MLATSEKQFTTIRATLNKKLKKMLSTCKLLPMIQILKKKLRKMFHMWEALSTVLEKACGKKLQRQESSLHSRINRNKMSRKKKKNKSHKGLSEATTKYFAHILNGSEFK
jgi:predicted unusual protein kinase regulating ubiquinone biosynthesis (AarF/ABC1/UbiB family)